MKLLVCGVIWAFVVLAASSASSADVAPVVIKERRLEIVIGADHEAARTVHLRLQAANDAAAGDIAEQRVPYNEALQTLEIIEAYTLKADGRKIAVAPDAIHTQQRRESPRQSVYDDLRQKVVIFPNVAGGDSIVLTARWQQLQSYLPGQFFFWSAHSPASVVEESTDTIIAPKDYPLDVENRGGEFTKEETATSIIYRWRYSSAKPEIGDAPSINPNAHGPQFHASSLRTYDEFGRAYAEMALPKVAVDSEIQALADRLTAGITNKRAQAQKIYNWVSRNIRYVALEFGMSAIIPHNAASVLRLAYGDCKDHSILFMALLKAKEIDSDIVLIDTERNYELSTVPGPASFNHALVYLPAFDLYADTTASVAPFGALPFGEYGKPVVHATLKGPVVRRIPVLSKGQTSVAVTSDARFDSDGRIIEDSKVTASGAFSIIYRNQAQDIQREGSSRYIAYMMQGAPHKASGNFEFADPLELEPTYVIASHIEYEPRPDWLSGHASFSMRRAFVSTPVSGDFLMGPLSQHGLTQSDPTVCYSGHVVEDLSFAPPPGRRFAALPEDFSLATANLEFVARWEEKGDAFILHREFTSRIDQPLCDGDLRKETSVALSQIADYYRKALIWLEPESTP